MIARLAFHLYARLGHEGKHLSNYGAELAGLDFGNLIGGPLRAAVEAQASAALSTINFINQVAYDATTPGKLKQFEMTYTKAGQTSSNVTLTVPFISTVPIPYIRIEEMTIDFNARINAVETRSVQSKFGADVSLGINYARVVEFKASASFQRTTSENSEVKRDYSMAIRVKAVQADIPDGMARVLGLLEGLIQEASTPATPVTPA